MTSEPEIAPVEYFDEEPNPIKDRLLGRIRWLRERGRIKDAELMEGAFAEIMFLEAGRK